MNDKCNEPIIRIRTGLIQHQQEFTEERNMDREETEKSTLRTQKTDALAIPTQTFHVLYVHD